MGNKLVNDDGKVKIFGFRSGKAYKMILAILYYALALYIVVTSLIGEIRFFSFQPVDVVLVIIKYIFIIVFFFSPLIFLSDFDYVYKIPLFKKKEKSASAIGIIIVLAFCYFMMKLNIYVGSDVYKNSVNEHTLKNNAQSVAPYEKKNESNELKLVMVNEPIAKGYKVQVCTNKSFENILIDCDYKKNKKNKKSNIKNIKGNEFLIKDDKLKNQKTLFVRAKNYGTVKKKNKKSDLSDATNVVIEGDWSDAKKVKILKLKQLK